MSEEAAPIYSYENLPEFPEGSIGYVSLQEYHSATPMILASGEELPELKVAYETYGTLNAKRDNAILVCHALSGDSHVAGYYEGEDPAHPRTKPGWWDDFVGPGKALDTDRFFIICSNVLGGCKGTTGPGSINPKTGEIYGLKFPVVTIADMVQAQKRLVDHLGIQKLLAVLGGSMGGMQALQWAVSYPDMMEGVIPVATTTSLSAQSLAFDAVGRNAIRKDPHFHNGEYQAKDDLPRDGLAIARMLGHITYLSEESMGLKFGRNLRGADELGYNFDSEFSIETYLDYQGEKFVDRFDANSYMYVTRAMDYFDLGQGERLEGILKDQRAQFLVISFRSDWLFTPKQSRMIVEALSRTGHSVTYVNIDSPYGHDAFLLEPETQTRLIRGFLQRLVSDRDRNSEATQEDLNLVFPRESGEQVGQKRVRRDLEWVEKLIEGCDTVLDMGCGRGRFLKYLKAKGFKKVQGVDMDQEKVIQCVENGIDCIQADLDHPLDIFHDKSFDVVLLSRTLQAVRTPLVVLKEVARIGEKSIVSFPNFAYWRNRIQIAFHGVTPVTRNLPFTWVNTPNLHYLTIKDFERWAKDAGVEVLDKVPLDFESKSKISFLPNLLATDAIYVFSGTVKD